MKPYHLMTPKEQLASRIATNRIIDENCKDAMVAQAEEKTRKALLKAKVAVKQLDTVAKFTPEEKKHFKELLRKQKEI